MEDLNFFLEETEEKLPSDDCINENFLNITVKATLKTGNKGLSKLIYLPKKKGNNFFLPYQGVYPQQLCFFVLGERENQRLCIDSSPPTDHDVCAFCKRNSRFPDRTNYTVRKVGADQTISIPRQILDLMPDFLYTNTILLTRVKTEITKIRWEISIVDEV